jgi:hypothetical protein
MAHTRDKPRREKKKPKKVKSTPHVISMREQETLSHVAGQDHHRWTTEQRARES